MPLMNGFTVCVLLYGDHVGFAQRCIRSIVQRADFNYVKEIRVGFNEVPDSVLSLMMAIVAEHVPSTVEVKFYVANQNICKYPMMRHMFYDIPIITQYVMWFDDDSYIDPTIVPSAWWAKVYEKAQQYAVLGSIYTITLTPVQKKLIMQQPWYGGKEFTSAYRARFVTGGWWVAQTRFLQRHDYPFKAIKHNGGDVMLGELCRQQGLGLGLFKQDVHINADPQGNESKAVRRGLSTKPVFSEENPENHEDLFTQPITIVNPLIDVVYHLPQQAEPSEPVNVEAPVAVPEIVEPQMPASPIAKEKPKLIRIPGL